MKHAIIAGFGFLMAAIALPGQDATKPSPTENKNLALFLPGPTCPVSMHALQGSGSVLVAVRDGKPPEGPAQRIHLILTGSTAARIVGAKVLVRGQTGKARITQAAPRANEDSNLSRTLHVAFGPEEANSVAVDLLLPGFTTVRSIELQSLTYRDGSTWAVAGEQACHVAPDPLMLVDSR
jgi:hypothetical protein